MLASVLGETPVEALRHASGGGDDQLAHRLLGRIQGRAQAETIPRGQHESIDTAHWRVLLRVSKRLPVVG